jgi:uncharacterized phosphosugar-binding protein
MAIGARGRGVRVIAATSVEHSLASKARHPRGRLLDHADLVIDLGTPVGDSLVTLDGMDTPVGPSSTVAAVAVVNEIKVRTAQLLLARGVVPPDRSAELFEAAYAEHARRAAGVIAGAGRTGE